MRTRGWMCSRSVLGRRARTCAALFAVAALVPSRIARISLMTVVLALIYPAGVSPAPTLGAGVPSAAFSASRALSFRLPTTNAIRMLSP